MGQQRALGLFLTAAVLAVTFAANSVEDEAPPMHPVRAFLDPLVSANPLFNPLGALLGNPLAYPRPQYNLLTLCRRVRCGYGTSCRLVQRCPTCPALATCLAPTTFPQANDQVCRAQAYHQTILLQRAAENATPLRCASWLPDSTRGGCPQGSTCLSEPLNPLGRGFCCTGGMQSTGAKPGVCPSFSPFDMCLGASCIVDAQCPGRRKCCPSICGGQRCRRV